MSEIRRGGSEIRRGGLRDTNAAIELRDVFCVHRTRDGDAAALQGLDLELEKGDFLCVLGPSGAGKTTLLRVIAGFQTPSAGVVRVLGRDVGRLPARARARLRHETIGFLDQHAESAVPPDLRVAQAVALPLAIRGIKTAARRARVAELLDAAELRARADAFPNELSGGERQRVALCAALAHRPSLLLADEPTGELDETSAAAMRELIATLTRAHGTTVIVVSHDARTAAPGARIVRIRDGRIVEHCSDGEGSLVVGRGGWLRLAPELLAQAGIGDHVRVRPVHGGLLVARTHARGGGNADPRSHPTRPLPQPAARAPTWTPARVELRSVSRSRGAGAGRRLVINGLSLTFGIGQMTAVTGRSGTGKTTLLRLLGGLDVPDAGVVTIDGRSLGACDAEGRAALRRERTGYLPQEPAPVGFLSAEENVVLALALRGIDPDGGAQRAVVALSQLGLSDRLRQRVARLSAGEAQRVALARALAGARGLLIVDEPTSRLDEAAAAAVAELLAATSAGGGQTVICATHDPEVIRRADHVIDLSRT
jgi:ABC-type lipoprotein export system ATPase subunit